MSQRDFDTSIFAHTGHRPWPMSDAPWVMTQTWHDLLFAHWPLDPARLAALVPPPFHLDLFDGMAWVGIVPFYMTNVAPRGVPSLPWLSAFPELNVRTYVRMDDRPGIYFFSLDAGRALAVMVARALFNLPYYTARMMVQKQGLRVDYRSNRASARGAAAFEATYRPVGSPVQPVPRSLEHFLTERYCLYHHSRGGVPYRLEIHHPPWLLQRAAARLHTNTIAAASAIDLAGPPALLHFARRQDMVAWMPDRLG